MPKIQIELSEDEDLTVSLFKVKYKLKDKREAIKEMIKMFKINFEISMKDKPAWVWNKKKRKE